MKIIIPLLTLPLLLLAGLSFADASCINGSCHPSMAKIEFPHYPVKEGNCLACHQEIADRHPIKGMKTFSIKAEGANLCNECHESLGKGKIVHAPVKGGECLVCHNPHGGKARNLLNSDDLIGVCTTCHDKSSFNQPSMHGPVAMGACAQCHDPHQAGEKGLLRQESRKICLSCHEDFAQQMTAALSVHPPVKNQPCTLCHSPHGSATANILIEKMPNLCFSCHKEIQKKHGQASHSHRPIKDEKSCANCHASHFSKARGLLPEPEQKLCLSCHGGKTEKPAGLRNVEKEITKKKTVHGPVAGGQCKICHDPHGSDYFRLLNGSFPDSFYTRYVDGEYGFCMRCHDRSMLKYPDTTMYTKFRNGKQNLHYVHVVADKWKSRTCRACHEPHASDTPNLISTEGPRFGEWKIPLRYEITPSGGSCAPGCHKKFGYDRNKAVDNLPDKKAVPLQPINKPQ